MSIRDAIVAAIRDGVALGRSDLEFVARRLHLSARTLQRKIAASGTSFSVLRDETRFELARSMLAQNDLSIGEIAYRLGDPETAPSPMRSPGGSAEARAAHAAAGRTAG